MIVDLLNRVAEYVPVGYVDGTPDVAEAIRQGLRTRYAVSVRVTNER